jgi:protein-S-isoprenylcysteine O-methyltransferase Ste14
MPKIPPPAYAAVGLLTQHLLASPRRPGRLRSIAGAAVGAGSLALIARANVQFHAHHTTVNPVEPQRATTLVTDGVFSLTRNPMYVGLAGLLAAHAVARGGWLTPLPVAGFVVLIDRLQIPAEEAALTDRFGGVYEHYRRAVPRWVGPR